MGGFYLILRKDDQFIADLLSCIRPLLAAPEAYDRMHLFERLAMLRVGSVFYISAIRVVNCKCIILSLWRGAN